MTWTGHASHSLHRLASRAYWVRTPRLHTFVPTAHLCLRTHTHRYLGFVQYCIYVPFMTRLWLPRAAVFARKPLRQRLTDVRGLLDVAKQVVFDTCVHNPFICACWFRRRFLPTHRLPPTRLPLPSPAPPHCCVSWLNLPPDFPCFYVMQAGVMSRGEPGWVRTGLTRWWRNFGDDWVSATAMWGTAGAVNFTVNPLWARVPFVALCSLVWSAILSAKRGNVGTDEAGALPPSASANVDQAPASNDSDTERPTMVAVNLTAAHVTAVVGMQDSEALVPDVEAALQAVSSAVPRCADRSAALA